MTYRELQKKCLEYKLHPCNSKKEEILQKIRNYEQERTENVEDDDSIELSTYFTISEEEETRFDPITLDYQVDYYRARKTDLLGKGSYGTVYRYGSQAIKIMVLVGELHASTITEIGILSKYAHPNITRIIDVVMNAEDHRGKIGIGLVMDLAIGDLYKVYKTGIHPSDKKDLSYQIMCGVAYLHHNDIMHRDLKPQNILVFNENNQLVAKITDVGMAAPFQCVLSKTFNMGVYTLWYRPPEILLEDSYVLEADIWALGVLLYELYAEQHLFEGDNDTNQLEQIANVIGTPTNKDYPNIENTPIYKKRYGKRSQGKGLPISINNNMKKIVLKCLRYNPRERPSAYDLLSDSYFDNIRDFDVEFNLQPCNMTLDKADVITVDPFNFQSKITPNNLLVLQDWIISLGMHYKLPLYVILSGIKILDIVLTKIHYEVADLQLLGSICLYIVSLDHHSLTVNDYVYMSKDAYTSDEFNTAMYDILKELQFDLIVTTPYLYLLDSKHRSYNEKALKEASLFILATSNIRYGKSSYDLYLIASSMVDLYNGIPDVKHKEDIRKIDFSNKRVNRAYKTLFKKGTSIKYSKFAETIRVALQ